MEHIKEALSFDDVLLVPKFSEILPSETAIGAQLTADIQLNIPVLSSAMDTVTEHHLAIALAREGGLGVIHRNCPIPDQVQMVEKVKRAESTVITKPLTIKPGSSIRQIKGMIEQTGVTGFPVVDEGGILQGIVSLRDIWFIEDDSKPIESVMTPKEKLITGSVDLGLEEAKAILYKHRVEKLPLIDDAGKLVGLITSADIEKRMSSPNAVKDANGHLRVGGAIGVGPEVIERAEALAEGGADALFIDAATGHTKRVLDVIDQIKSKLPDTALVAGNVVTAKGALDLIAAGADAIKVGVGPGSICTTRVIAGVGVPQFTAVLQVAEACQKKGVTVIADGGIRYSGDIVKALAAGANLVMMGSAFAGCEESPGNRVRWQGRTFKEYRGMGSENAMRKGSGDRYGQNASGKLVPEGVEARVPYKGPLSDTLFQLMGGLRSGMGYLGARDISDLQSKASFVRITSGGLKESHPHDIVITEEPVNYSNS